jgi:DNA repair exonuclease SbcCD ATPase subunit
MGAKGKPQKGFDASKATGSANAETEVVDEVEAKTETESDPVDEVEESDLEEIEEAGKIPYARFKEVNERAKSAESRIKEMEKLRQLEVSRLESEIEAKLKAKLLSERETEEEELLDPTEKRVKSLERQISDLNKKLGSYSELNETDRIQSQLDKLAAKYQEADQLAVLGWRKIRPNADLEELMELSHTQNVSRAKKALTDLLEKKKQKKQLTASGHGVRVKPSTPIKTMSEANKYMKSLFK